MAKQHGWEKVRAEWDAVNSGKPQASPDQSFNTQLLMQQMGYGNPQALTPEQQQLLDGGQSAAFSGARQGAGFGDQGKQSNIAKILAAFGGG